MSLTIKPNRRHALALAAAGVAALALPLGTARAQGKLKIGTIGAGSLGGAVGALWVKAGHEVMFSSRSPDELKTLVAELGPNARAGTVQEAIAFGDAILLAIPYAAYPEAGKAYGEALKGKIVMDAGNANRSDLFEETKRNGIGVTTKKFFPGARLVRAFNAANNRLFTENAGKEPRMAIPLAGDDAAALKVVSDLVTSARLEPLVVGGLKDADRFAMGTDGFGHVLPAKELAAKLGVTH
ncbi:NAD(P)-binding domain-containing protein [Methylopila sp. M107]|uniref:NADPH-dependent F420 reductase n=1 Tax=Methylopila sp. M107 TaxID=1101190 RepID=UPI000366024C|nr:NAD(P)-binding domain-containing protein [Methylopila sp. M107]